MNPFPRKQTQETNKLFFYYKLSIARMTVECAFGIASLKFIFLLKAIETSVENADHMMKAICIYHVIIDNEKYGSSNQKMTNTFNETNANNNQLMEINSRSKSNNRASRTVIHIRK